MEPRKTPIGTEMCAICDCEAVRDYEGEPSCGRVKCELEIQAAMDYHADRDWS